MAAPHVTGVAALVISRLRERLAMNRDFLSGLTQLAGGITDRIACPDADDLARYSGITSVNNGAPQTCTGTITRNSWYGYGQINAFKAVNF
jgi:hypothetical protein